MTEEEEKQAMRDYLAQGACKCGGKFELTGSARYTDPIQWDFRCSHCCTEGFVYFTTIRREHIEHTIFRVNL